MKYGIIILLISFSLRSYSQSKDTIEQNMRIVTVEQSPHFTQDLTKYVNKHTKYPKDALKDNITGTVLVSFTTDKNGKLNNIKLKEGIRNDIDEAALNVVRKMPKCYPAKRNGRPFEYEMTIPIVFSIGKQ